MELILPGLFLFFVVFPLGFLWLAVRLARTAHRLAQHQPFVPYPLEETLRQTFEPEPDGVWPPPPRNAPPLP